jgi:hypothetical protein
VRVIEDELYLCVDCTIATNNGDYSGMDAEQEKATRDGLTKLGPYVVCNFDSETGDGLEQFSNTPCAACETTLAGYRARHAQLGD